MASRLVDFIRGLFSRRPVRLAIVRRYLDANGSYVGELYMEQEQGGISSFRMIGASLDTLPLFVDRCHPIGLVGTHAIGKYSVLLDTRNDFLVPMTPGTLRVGALDPAGNDKVREMVARMPRRNMTLIVQNRFIGRVLGQP